MKTRSLLVALLVTLTVMSHGMAISSECKRSVSVELKASVDRPSSRLRSGSCQANEEAEHERQQTDAKLECLANGYEDAYDLKISCTRIRGRGNHAQQGFSLHYEAHWRCLKMVCEEK